MRASWRERRRPKRPYGAKVAPEAGASGRSRAPSRRVARNDLDEPGNDGRWRAVGGAPARVPEPGFPGSAGCTVRGRSGPWSPVGTAGAVRLADGAAAGPGTGWGAGACGGRDAPRRGGDFRVIGQGWGGTGLPGHGACLEPSVSDGGELGDGPWAVDGSSVASRTGAGVQPPGSIRRRPRPGRSRDRAGIAVSMRESGKNCGKMRCVSGGQGPCPGWSGGAGCRRFVHPVRRWGPSRAEGRAVRPGRGRGHGGGAGRSAGPRRLPVSVLHIWCPARVRGAGEGRTGRQAGRRGGARGGFLAGLPRISLKFLEFA